MQLIGKLYRAADGWTADWTFLDRGKVLATRSVTERSANRAIASGADVAADAMSRKYAKRSAVGPAGSYRVMFTGIDSAEDYIRLSAYLQKQPLVKRITPLRAVGNTAEFQLELATGVSGLKRMAERDGVIAGGDGEPPVFQLR